MSLLTSVLLVLDILCLVASAVVFVVFMVIALVKKIRKEPAKKYAVNGLVYCLYCLMASVIVTWVMKVGLSLTQKMQAL